MDKLYRLLYNYFIECDVFAKNNYVTMLGFFGIYSKKLLYLHIFYFENLISEKIMRC